MPKFFATIEFLFSQSAALVSLTDEAGEFAGAGRIELPRCFWGLREALYMEGYRLASVTASSKGGRLERFTAVN